MYLSNSYFENILLEASKVGTSVTLTAEKGSIPTTCHKILNDAIASQVPSHNCINFIKITRLGKLLVYTQSAETAITFLKIKSLLNIAVIASYLAEEISTSFLLYNIDPLVDCTGIVEEFDLIRVKTLEMRRFLRQSSTPNS